MRSIIHPTAILGPNVRIGRNNIIGPHCIVAGDTIIGDNNRLEASVHIGFPPEHKQAWKDKKWKSVHIGNDNIFRSFVTIDSGFKRDTQIGDRCVFLNHSHVGHDCILGNDVTLACATLAGHVTVFDGVTIGLNASVHQWQVLGAWSMIAGKSFVDKKSRVLPGTMFGGIPARYMKQNERAIKLFGVTDDQMSYAVKQYQAAVNGS